MRRELQLQRIEAASDFFLPFFENFSSIFWVWEFEEVSSRTRSEETCKEHGKFNERVMLKVESNNFKTHYKDSEFSEGPGTGLGNPIPGHRRIDHQNRTKLCPANQAPNM